MIVHKQMPLFDGQKCGKNLDIEILALKDFFLYIVKNTFIYFCTNRNLLICDNLQLLLLYLL